MKADQHTRRADDARVAGTRPEKCRAQDFGLAREAAGGDALAFEELYKRHSGFVHSVCLRMTRNTAEAEDLTQEVFIQVLRKLAGFRGESAFSTWLYRLSVNQVLMHFRKKYWRDTRPTPEHFSGPPIGREPAGRDDSLARVALKSAIARLPPGYRRTLVLYDVAGFNHQEIADMLGCSDGTSKSQLHKARMKLRSVLWPR